RHENGVGVTTLFVASAVCLLGCVDYVPHVDWCGSTAARLADVLSFDIASYLLGLDALGQNSQTGRDAYTRPMHCRNPRRYHLRRVLPLRCGANGLVKREPSAIKT